jgi:CRISPR-associated protein Cmr5
MQQQQSQQEERGQQPQSQHISRRHTIEQQRGAQAWEDIRAIKDLDKKLKKEKKLEQEYRSLARGLNAMIQINGLGQTLGFFLAKGKRDESKAHYQLLSHLTTWMQDPEHFYAKNSEVMRGGYDGLLTWVLNDKTGSDDYRRATTECLAFGTWLSRFAEAELKDPQANNAEQKATEAAGAKESNAKETQAGEASK